MQPTGILKYTGTDYGCSTNFDQCYWTDAQSGKEQCGMWPDCRHLYQSDKHAPATTGNPVYWARGDGESAYEKGAVLWTQTGNINDHLEFGNFNKVSNKYITIKFECVLI